MQHDIKKGTKGEKKKGLAKIMKIITTRHNNSSSSNKNTNTVITLMVKNRTGCNDNACRKRFGAIDNYASSHLGESMYAYGFARCLTCNCWYEIDKMTVRTNRKRSCRCCDGRLRFKPLHKTSKEWLEARDRMRV